MSKISKLLTGQFRTAFILIILMITATILSPVFLTAPNLLNVLLEVAVTAILAIGETFIIINGEIDLSVGAIVGLSGAITAGILQHSNLGVALIVCILIGAGAGLLNGILVTYGKVPSFIATLGTMTAFSGLTLVYTGGNPIAITSNGFQNLGQGYLLGVPIPVWFMVVLYVLFWFLLHRTYYGRYIFAVGGNREASRLSGINVFQVKNIAFLLTGILSAVAGVLLTARLNSAEPTTGSGLEMDAITAVILGGTSLAGGKGTLLGTIFGAIILGVLDDGMNLLNVSAFYQNVVKGIIIILAVLLDSNIDSLSKLKKKKPTE